MLNVGKPRIFPKVSVALTTVRTFAPSTEVVPPSYVNLPQIALLGTRIEVHVNKSCNPRELHSCVPFTSAFPSFVSITFYFWHLYSNACVSLLRITFLKTYVHNVI